ncbi:MAG: hypothetical protein JW863_14850 [Chitinispirillaceae bacterium]|nr:hypothetical protein [Chitinispirillaceae bacterium]
MCLEKKLSQVTAIAILPLKFDSYHLTAGGIREYNNTMSTAARRQITSEVERMLSKKGYNVTTLSDDRQHHRQWARMRHFYSVVNGQIENNVFGLGRFPSADKMFAYSVPPISDSLDNSTADAFLFIDGFDDRATRKREKRKVAAAVGAAIGAALTGIYVTNSVPADRTFASCALVNRWGEIIWYFLYTETGKIDMAQHADCERFVSNLLGRLGKRQVQP